MFVLLFCAFLYPTPLHTTDHFWNVVRTLEKSLKVRAVEDENLLEPSAAGSDAILDSIRVARETNLLNNNDNNQINTDQAAQASAAIEKKADESPSSSLEELTLDSLDDDENRGKRFVFMIDAWNY